MCGDVYMWGIKDEIKVHVQLSAMDKHKHKTPAEISEIVFAEHLDLKMRQQLYEKVLVIDYDENL